MVHYEHNLHLQKSEALSSILETYLISCYEFRGFLNNKTKNAAYGLEQMRLSKCCLLKLNALFYVLRICQQYSHSLQWEIWPTDADWYVVTDENIANVQT